MQQMPIVERSLKNVQKDNIAIVNSVISENL